MRRVLTIPRVFALVSLLSLVLVSGAMAEDYGWSLSFSDTDSEVNTSGPFAGTGTVYLWLQCNLVDGAAAFGANVTGTNGVVIAGFTPVSGVLNAGTATALALAIGGCPDGPFLVGSFFLVGTSFDLCMDTVITVDCDQITPTEWPSGIVGASAGGGTVCVIGGCTTATEPSSWGSLKGLYR